MTDKTADRRDHRFIYIKDRLKDLLLVGDQEANNRLAAALNTITDENADNYKVVQAMLNGAGANHLLFLYQARDGETAEEVRVVDPSKESPVIKKRCVFCARPQTGKPIQNRPDHANIVQELQMGSLEPNVIESFEHLLNDVFQPVLEKMGRWGKNSDAERHAFLNNITKFTDHLHELRYERDSKGKIELQKVDDALIQQLRSGAGKSRGAADPKNLQVLQNAAESWMDVVRTVVDASPVYSVDVNDEHVGPLTELEEWKKRLAKLNLVVDQLQAVKASTVIGILRDAKNAAATRWAVVDASLTEAVSEAKENVKYLASLDKFLEVLYPASATDPNPAAGTPKAIIVMLPALVNNIKMMYTIARFYSTIPRMTTLFYKITNQMITACKATINPSGRRADIWEQVTDLKNLRKLIENLQACIELNKAYQAEYKEARDTLKAKNPRGKLFEFNELKLFGHFDLFTKRVDKLISVFRTAEQFMLLKSYNIDQMEGLIERFEEHFMALKSTKDILNIHDDNVFDAAYAQFNKSIQELETSLQVTINSAFENITSTENALVLLRKFQTILQTETFKSDLDSKYMVIFHNYGLELENDQKLYERHKSDPPLVRNITPVAGAITWARQLLRHIKGPMDKFATNDTVMNNPKESKKIIRTYNKVSLALIDYEAIWVDAWKRSIDSSKAGLNATLLVRDTQTGKLFVNFDIEILQLIKETRAIMRLGGIDIPPQAKMVLMQEQKLKTYLNELSYLVKEYERIVGRIGADKSVSKIIPMTRAIMQPNLDAVDAAIRHGENTLTWTSLNIDSFIQSVTAALTKLDGVVTKVNDIVTNRIHANLKLVSSTLLVNLQDDHFALEKFVFDQETYISKQSVVMDVKNQEVETAADDVINTILANQEPRPGQPQHEGSLVPRDKIVALKMHFNRLMFTAILTTTTRSLNLIKKRVGTRNRSSFMYVDKPFFDVDIQLVSNEVVLHPSLDEVQKAINQSATAVLSCSKKMTQWRDLGDNYPSFFEEIAKNKEIVKVVLLLTGGIHGLRKQVNEYLSQFKKYEYLWRLDKEEEYQKFMQTNPTLEDFESALRKFVVLEQEVMGITSTYNIGSLSLGTEPLKNDLRKKAQEWKEQYARNLHTQAQRALDRLIQQMDEDDRQLSQQAQENLEELRVMMETLKSIRERESEIEFMFEPVEEMYTLLSRYNVHVEKDEADRVSELRFKWKKLRATAEKRTDEINQLQHGFKKNLTQEVQKFSTDVITFRNDFEANGPMVEGIKPAEAMERLRRYQRQFDDKWRKWDTYMKGEELFGLPQHHYPELARTKKELDLLEKLYTLYNNVEQKVKGYNERLWCDLDFDKIAEEVNVFVNQCKKLPKSLREWDAYVTLKKTLDDFIELQPIVKDLKSNPMQPRHWQEIMRLTGVKWSIDETVFKLQNIVDANVLKFRDEVPEIAKSSQQEKNIEEKFTLIVEQCKVKELKFMEFKNRGPIQLHGEEMMKYKEEFEEFSLQLNSFLSSRYCNFMRDTIKAFDDKICAVSETIGQWLEVQSTWMYLEAVFAGGDIMKQLPAEAKRFAAIDKSWTKILNKANEQKNVLDFCFENELLTATLPQLKDGLEDVQRKLAAYLEQKRNLFPRFYFVSDSVLLEILSKASDPSTITTHLCSIFDGLSNVRFERIKPREAGAQPYLQIVEMISAEDERLAMHEPLPCLGNVEDWLNNLCDAMCHTVRQVAKDSVAEVGNVQANVHHLASVIDRFPAQVSLLVLQMLWTSDVTECILGQKSGKNKAIVKQTEDKIVEVKTFLINYTKSPELEQKPKRFRTNVETLITIQVHQEEVFYVPLKTVTNIGSFDWLRQSRFSYKPEKELVVIAIADTETDYCNEYLGVKERLVITQLTDRCYITLSQAIGMYMGGAPAGPAGTGKTETTKDLARTYGKFCVVFNCSDQLDRTAMGKIIRGLSQANAWGCFDEFNRIELPVLSVVAQQIDCVLKALKQRKTEFTFIDGQNTVLKPGVGFFITMNPGYAGRQELPENLKILFRGVTMMVPDRQAIMKVKLASQGYQTNGDLSKKFFTLYKLCEEQLSKQRHYDFGLRNILSVLRTAGAVLRRSPKDPEDFLFMRTCRDMNLSKLVLDDIELFDKLLEDMFPGLNALPSRYPEIEGEIQSIIARKGLQFWKKWVEKIIQLYETKQVRHGIMVVGPALCGKTQCYDVMTEALTEMKLQATIAHLQLRMNPKAITAQQMFGRLEVSTGDWYDGVFAALWRKARSLEKKSAVWIICDGPVDAIWIENLNTVLDDNKLLTLANGDRLFMTETMKCCFEVENLMNASPATVSRAGIVFISDSVLGWRPIVASRLRAKRDDDGKIRPVDVFKLCQQQLAERLVNMYIPPLVESKQEKGEMVDTSLIARVADFYAKECVVVMKTSTAHQVLNSFYLAVALGEEVGDGPLSDELVQQIFWFSIAWSFGGMLEMNDRNKFDNFVRQFYKGVPSGEKSTIFDYKLNVKTGQWEHWNNFVEKWRYPGDAYLDFSTLFIPTMDSERLHYLTKCNFMQQHPVLCMGVSGTAKTVTIEKFLVKMRGTEGLEALNFKKINFSSLTTPQNFYNMMDDLVEKTGQYFSPKGGGQLALFIDDMNMPEINNWGDQITNEIVRQVVEGAEYYALEKGTAGEKKRLKRGYMFFLGAMSHPSGGKNDIPNRLKRHFAVFNCPLPDDVSINQIFGTIFDARFAANYNPATVQVAQKLTSMSVQFWRAIGKKMLPTPMKFHYFFNLRDLSNIAQGLMLVGMLADPDRPDKRMSSKPWETLRDPVTLLQAWRHEVTRVFSDKLNTVDDKKWFDANLQDIVAQNLGKELAEQTKEPVYFVNFLREPVIDHETGEQVEPAPKIYEPAGSIEQLQDRLLGFMNAHDETPVGKIRKLDLVLFDSAVKHVGRVVRALGMPRGNLLMVGVGGSGKQSLVRLATFVTGYDYATLVISKGFGVNQLFDAIREQYMNASCKRSVAMLFTDNEIKQEIFLEYINSFLSNGEISGLFAADQRDNAVNEMRPIGKKDPMTKGKFEETSEYLWKYFINRVRDRLHFVLCFSPVGEKFRTRARKFPALVSSCVINWFFPWPDKALLSVSGRTLKSFKMDTDDKTKDSLKDLMAAIHSMMLERSDDYFQRYRRSVFSTPKSYLNFIASYTSVYKKKFDFFNDEAKKIANGLKKLQQAAEDVRAMRTELAEKEVQLMQKRKETDVLVKEIEKETADAQEKQRAVEVTKNRCQADAAKVSAGEAEARRDLAAAEPALLAAEEALNSITDQDFVNLRALRTPPALIKRIFDGVAILLFKPMAPPDAVMESGKAKPWIKDSWDVGGKALAMNPKTLGDLQSFGREKKDLINEETCELLLPYLWMEDFTYERAKLSSGNVAGLCTWVRSMWEYITIAKVVGPKKERLRLMVDELKAANRKLQAEEDNLKIITENVAGLNRQFQEKNAVKAALEADAEMTKRRMESAHGLIEALSGERERWTSQSNEFQDTIRRLVGDVCLACAFISYCGPFNAEFRHMLLNTHFFNKCKSLRIPVSDNLSIVRFLVEDTVVNDWQLEGLPSDDHSVQNAIMMTTSTKFSLMIDPQGQALQWLRRRTEKDGALVVQMGDKQFLSQLQTQMEWGRPLIIENVSQDLDPVLDPLLDRQLRRVGNTATIKINDQEMIFNDKFQLYMTTKLPNPSFIPELFAKCLIIDFTVTMKGLEQQLLSQVIGQEKAELNEETAKLAEEINNNEKRRKNLEDRLLKQLSESTGNLIDDVTLIQTLQETQDASEEIKEKLTVAVETKRRIENACQEYRPVAIRGSVLYFLIVEMSLVNPMYQTSLPQFLELFDGAIRNSEKPSVTQKRIHAIVEYLTFSVFCYIVRGLFSRHKTLFVLLMACKIQMKDGKLDPVAFDVFLKGGASLSHHDKPKPFTWISDKAWLNCVAVAESSTKTFKQLTELITRSERAWRDWMEKECCEGEPVPDINDKLEPFDRLLLIRALREDRTMLAASNYVAAQLGKHFAEPQQLDLTKCVEECQGIIVKPIIFLLSQGSDPTSLIENGIAKKMKKKVHPISMGQGQEPAAHALVDEAIRSGDWVLLQNCHLGLPFLGQLEDKLRVINQQQTVAVHEEARVWITAEPHPAFPIGLLQMSLKLTNEPPQGIKAGIIGSYSSLPWLSQDTVDQFRRPEWKPMLFSLFFLHSVVVERRKFGPMGFCLPYEFNAGDLTASELFLANHVASVELAAGKNQVNWETVRYMVAEIQYGGRITDNKDRELFNTITKHVFDARICRDGFAFVPNGNRYIIPAFDEIVKQRDFVRDTYPDVDPPEAFGMTPNADITYRTRQAIDALSTILEVQPRGAAASGGISREDKVLGITDAFLKQLPDRWAPDKRENRNLNDRQPLSIFAAQEIDRLIVTIRVIRVTCQDLRLAVAGTIIMTPQLQDALDYIFDARVPPSWIDVSWLSSSISLWFGDVIRRWQQLDKWATDGRPQHYWLPGFFNPQGFLTSVRQEITRDHNKPPAPWALDKVETRTEVRAYEFRPGEKSDADYKKDDLPENKAVLIYGMFLDGCAWNKTTRRIVDSVNGELFKELPVMVVTAGLLGERRDADVKGKGARGAAPLQNYRCPVYKYPVRTDNHWVFDVDLPCDEANGERGDAFWRMRGVALLCSKE